MRTQPETIMETAKRGYSGELVYYNHKGDYIMDDANRILAPEEKAKLLRFITAIFGSPEMPDEAIDELIFTKDTLDTVNTVLSTLTERERAVIEARVLEGRTLEETAEAFGGVSRELIRQTEAKAFRKLRHPSRSRLVRNIVVDVIKPAEDKYNKTLGENKNG